MSDQPSALAVVAGAFAAAIAPVEIDGGEISPPCVDAELERECAGLRAAIAGGAPTIWAFRPKPGTPEHREAEALRQAGDRLAVDLDALACVGSVGWRSARC